MSYDQASRLVVSINPLGDATTTVFDQLGRSIARIDPLGNISSTLYDAFEPYHRWRRPSGQRQYNGV